MNIIEKIYSTLTPLGYPVFLQGTLGDDPYPDNFITYWIANSESDAFYDNAEHQYNWQISIIFYTKNINSLVLVVPKIIDVLKVNQFILQGKGAPIASDEQDTIGWVLDCTSIEN